MASTTRPRIVFLLALIGRSGTNHLLNLISHHPSVTAALAPFWEDYLLHEAHHLQTFANHTFGHWAEIAGDRAPPPLNEDLKANLGEALCRFVTRGIETPFMVTKTPSVQNLDLMDTFFPREKLIIILRDGRDIMASGMQSFGWSLEESATDWAEAADRLLAFCDQVPNDRRLIVRFEDLARDPEHVLEKTFRYIGIDPAAYQWNKQHHRQVIGSSSLRREAGDLDWVPIDKPPDFDPVGRWQSWTAAEKRLFDQRAGRQFEALKALV